jgi:hypothetical protein
MSYKIRKDFLSCFMATRIYGGGNGWTAEIGLRIFRRMMMEGGECRRKGGKFEIHEVKKRINSKVKRTCE